MARSEQKFEYFSTLCLRIANGIENKVVFEWYKDFSRKKFSGGEIKIFKNNIGGSTYFNWLLSAAAN